MLKEFLAGYQKLIVPGDQREREKQALQSFFGVFEFLGRPDRLPNRRVNELTWRVQDLFMKDEIKPVIDPFGEYPYIAYINVDGASSMIIIPPDYLRQLSEEPLFHIGNTAFILAEADLAFTDYIGENPLKNEYRIATAFSAEVLLAIDDLARRERIQITWHEACLEVIEQFPQGMKTLGLLPSLHA